MRASRTIFIPALLLLLAAGRVHAQEEQPPQEKPLSAADVESRIESLKTATGLEEVQRAAALEAYQQALKELKDAATFAEKADGYDAAAKSAPKDLEDIKAKLASPPATFTPQYGPETPKSELEKALDQARSDVETRTKALDELKKLPEQRAARRKEIVDLVVAEKKRVEELAARKKQPAAEGEPAELAAAKRAQASATHWESTQRLRSLEAELARIDAAKDLLPARIQLATREKEQAEARLGRGAKSWTPAARPRPTPRAPRPSARAKLPSGITRWCRSWPSPTPSSLPAPARSPPR